MHLDTAVKNSVFGYPNTCVWKSIRKSNTQLKQSLITSIVCCFHLRLQWRLSFRLETCARCSDLLSSVLAKIHDAIEKMSDSNVSSDPVELNFIEGQGKQNIWA